MIKFRIITNSKLIISFSVIYAIKNDPEHIKD